RGSLSMGRGTPYYMAPEMLQRRGDQRSDIYSMGVMLYEILCGGVPFTGDSEWEVLRKHEQEPPSLPAHLSGLERAVLQRCLQKDPAARFQSVHELIAAFGAPAGVGAAAWTDVRNAPPKPPPVGPGPRSVPPPLPGVPPPPVEDPYAGLGRASREAARHARKIARRAVEQARKASRKHLAGMHEAWREKRRRRAVSRAATFPPRRARAHPILAFAVMLAVVAVFWTVMGVRAPSVATEAATPWPAPMQPVLEEPLQVLSSDGLFRSLDVPKSLRGVVTLREPAWVELARRDPDEAERAIEQHLAELQVAAPWQAARRAQYSRLPKLTIVRVGGKGQDLEATNVLVDRFAQAPAFDQVVAAQIEQLGPSALARVAARLGEVDWKTEQGRARGRRLHELLQDATGCREIEYAEPGTMSPDEVVRANSQLADLWSWFLNEFAHTPAAWRTFQQLQRGR
ncbi:MAG TPA: protein kinase, partial [Planctomycetota bacterium]|nr:protein kinase [Planctomycetota bacterium]